VGSRGVCVEAAVVAEEGDEGHADTENRGLAIPRLPPGAAGMLAAGRISIRGVADAMVAGINRIATTEAGNLQLGTHTEVRPSGP